MAGRDRRAPAGETRDTAVMGLVGDFLSDKFVPRAERINLFRTWGSGLGMLPIGGAKAWGNASWAPDDTPEMVAANITHGRAARGPPCQPPGLNVESTLRSVPTRLSAAGVLRVLHVLLPLSQIDMFLQTTLRIPS